MTLLLGVKFQSTFRIFY